MGRLVLAGDVGGTKTQLALFAVETGGRGGVVRSAPIAEERFESKSPGGLGSIVARFLESARKRPDVACFGVAGPVVAGRVVAPNLPFTVDAAELATLTGAREVALLNDLEAAAYGVAGLGADEIRTLQPGKPEADAPIAVIAAGTGLGEAALLRDGGRLRALASEGGHADFAPTDDEQAGLWRAITAEEGRASYERVLAGPGIARVYDHLRAASGEAEPPEVARRLAAADDRSAEISALALEGADPVAVRALRLFAKAYGAEAGNLALRTLCFGGLFVAGGIAPKVLPFLEDGRFLAAFRAKGRVSAVVDRVPVHVVLEPRAPLLGAAAYGAAMAD